MQTECGMIGRGSIVTILCTTWHMNKTGASRLEWNSDSLVAQAVLLFLAETALAAEDETGHNNPVANLHALDLGPNVLHEAHELVAKDVAFFHPGLRKMNE